jgi:hypothetical protein
VVIFDGVICKRAFFAADFNSSLPATVGLKKDAILLDDDDKVASLCFFFLTWSLMSALLPCDIENVELHSVHSPLSSHLYFRMYGKSC